MPAPELKHGDEGILLTDELHQWLRDSRAKYDWLFFVDAQARRYPAPQARPRGGTGRNQ